MLELPYILYFILNQIFHARVHDFDSNLLTSLRVPPELHLAAHALSEGLRHLILSDS